MSERNLITEVQLELILIEPRLNDKNILTVKNILSEIFNLQFIGHSLTSAEEDSKRLSSQFKQTKDELYKED